MADKNPNPNEAEKLRDGELDHMLDAALAGYTVIEPRQGLEDRILANLRAEQTRVQMRGWWQWGLAGAAAVIVIVAGLAWRLTRPSQPAIANHPPSTMQHRSTQKTDHAPQSAGEVIAAKRSPARKPSQPQPVAATAVAAHPKLDQFPSQQPLSAEEIALTQYVKNFPKDAQLVAQAQEEFALETENEMNDAGSQTRPSGSIQQER